MNSGINKRLLICRTCLCRIEDSDQFIPINNYAKTLNYENMLIIDMIEKCSPELDLDISDDVVICNSCYDLLISTYEFKCKCLQTEEKIYLFIETSNLTLSDKIDLIDLVKGTNFDEYSKSEHFEPLPSILATSNTENTTIKDDNAIKSESDAIIVNDSEEESDPNFKWFEIKQIKYLKRGYSCDKCEYKAYRRDLLEEHLLSKCKSRVKSMKYKCDDCPYTTIRQRHLTRHKFTHGETRPYICGICNKGFTEKTNIRNHIMYKHSGCKICSATMSKHTDVSICVQLPYKCGERGCKAYFPRRCDLKAHMVKHND